MSTVFTDVGKYVVSASQRSEYWAFDFIYYMANEGIVKGFGDSTFQPSANTTIAQFCAMSIRAADIGGGDYSDWSENDPPHWAKNFIDFATDNGFFERVELAGSGLTDYHHYSDVPIQRQLAFYILWRAFTHDGCRRPNILTDSATTFAELSFTDPDVADIVPEQYQEAIAQLFSSGVVTGYEDGTIRPEENITRAEVCAILYRMLKIELYTPRGPNLNVRETPNGNILHETEPGSNHIFKRALDGRVEAGDFWWVKIHFYNPVNLTWVIAWVAEHLIVPFEEHQPSVPASGREIVIPNTLYEMLNGVSKVLYPRTNWFSYQGGSTPKDENSRYRVVVGPRVINPNYPDIGRIWTDYDGLSFPVRIDAILEHRTTGQSKIIECSAVRGGKAHTFNNYPDSLYDINARHPRDAEHPITGELLFKGNIMMQVLNGDTGNAIDSGLIQTGIAYPNSWNSTNESQVALANRDSSTVEFDCKEGDLDFNPKSYRLIKIVVHDI